MWTSRYASLPFSLDGHAAVYYPNTKNLGTAVERYQRLPGPPLYLWLTMGSDGISISYNFWVHAAEIGRFILVIIWDQHEQNILEGAIGPIRGKYIPYYNGDLLIEGINGGEDTDEYHFELSYLLYQQSLSRGNIGVAMSAFARLVSTRGRNTRPDPVDD